MIRQYTITVDAHNKTANISEKLIYCTGLRECDTLVITLVLSIVEASFTGWFSLPQLKVS